MGDKGTPTGPEETRSLFEQDYDRIIFSYPFRCLQDKTQVLPLPKTDFVHTRLTHSLEVSSVGRSLGKKTGKTIAQRNPGLRKQGFNEFDFGAIVAAASLAHDIGNPPFGHSGEDAISEYFIHDPFGKTLEPMMNASGWMDITHFEGNAQGFRLLTRENYQGLRITHATLSAFSKYPRESLFPEQDPARKSQKKFGFFQSEKEKFRLTAECTDLIRRSKDYYCWSRHPLAFLVEAADDICYSIIDLEDGCNLGLVSLETTRDLLVPIIGDKFQAAKFNNIKDKREQVSLLRAMAIASLVEQVSGAFLDREKDIVDGRFDNALASVIPARDALKEIITVSVDHIYRSAPVLEKETAGFEVITGLLDAYLQASVDYYRSNRMPARKNMTIINLFPVELKRVLNEENTSMDTIVMHLLDHLTLMTDSLALETYRRIKGISLPGI